MNKLYLSSEFVTICYKGRTATQIADNNNNPSEISCSQTAVTAIVQFQLIFSLVLYYYLA